MLLNYKLKFLMIIIFLSGCIKLNQKFISIKSPVLKEDHFAIPTASPGAGIVTGQLLTPGPGGAPYIATLYLGTLIYPQNKDNGPPLIVFSEQKSLKAIQDPQTGRFYFAEVPPGRYVIIIWTPAFSMPLRDVKSGKEIILEVNPGDIVDLGIITIP